MYTAKAQNAYDDEPFHFKQTYDLADIICEGSDTDETAEQIEQKHLRYEASAERCASGKLPVLQSTVLRGLLTSSWINPWRCESNKAHGEKKRQQSRLEKLSSNSGSVPRRAAISDSYYLSPNGTISQSKIPGEEKENEADASEADGEISQLARGRGTENLSSDRIKEFHKISVPDNGRSCKVNDTIGSRIKKGIKRHRKSHSCKNINTYQNSNWDNKSYSLHESFRQLAEKGRSRNGEFEAELLEDHSPLIFNQNKRFDARKLFLNSMSSSASPFSSPVPAPKRQRIKYKTKIYKDKFPDVQSDDCDSEDSNSINSNRKLSIYATISQNSVITPNPKHIVPSTNFTRLKNMDRDIFVTNCAPSSRALEKFVYKTKKRKRDSSSMYGFTDPSSPQSEDCNYSLARKKKKFLTIEDNDEDFLLLDNVDIQKKGQKFSLDSDYSLNMINQKNNSHVFPDPQPSKNMSDNNQRYFADYFLSILDSTEDKIAWRQEYSNGSTPDTSPREIFLTQSFHQNNEEQSFHTRSRPKSKRVVSNIEILKPDEKVSRSRFTQRFAQKPLIYQDNQSKSIPKASIPQLENGSQDFFASPVTSFPPQKIKPDSNIFSTIASNILSQQQMNQEFSLDLTVTESQKAIEALSPSSLSVPIIFDQQESSPVIQFSTRKMLDSSSVTSPAKDRAPRLSLNQRNSRSQILNLSPCASRTSQLSKCSNSIVPKICKSKDCNDRSNVSLPLSSEKEFYAAEDKIQMENSKQDEFKKSTEAPPTEQQEVSFSPLINQESAKTTETFHTSKVDTPLLGIVNSFKANFQSLESNYAIKKSDQVIIETLNLSDDKLQSSGRQSPWAPEIQTLSVNFDGPRKLPDSASCSLGYNDVNIYVSPHSSPAEDKINIISTPENKVTLSLNPSFIVTPHQDSQKNKMQKSIDSASKNPWKSSIKKASSVTSKKRVSFQQSTKSKEDIPSGKFSASPPNNSSVRISSQQPDQMSNPTLSIETPKKLFSETIPNLTTLSKSYSHSEANCSPRLSAMAEAFIAADQQTYSEEKDTESSLLKDQIVLSSKYNDNDKSQLVTTTKMTTTTKESKNSDIVNDHYFNIDNSNSISSINGNEQKELQSNCWLDSPSIASLKDIDFGILAAENNSICDPLLSGVEDFLEDWSIDNVLK